VLCGCNDEGVQTLVNSINWMLGNYGSTIDLDNHTYFHQGDDAAVAQLVKDMAAGKVDALLIAGVNPAYSLPNATEFKEALKKVALSVSFSGYADETASLCAWITPDSHYLESWNDFLPKPGHYALAQPAINKLYDTRQWQESLLKWSGVDKHWYDFVRTVWEAGMTGSSAAPLDFVNTWNMAVHNGVHVAYANMPGQWSFAGDVSAAGNAAKKMSEGAGEWQLRLYVPNGVGNGLHANNPWLQELPDPLTKITWDNYLTMSPADMEVMGLQIHIGQDSPASVCALKVGDIEMKLPVVAVPGQKQGVAGLALGYGRGANGEKVGLAAVATDPGSEELKPVGQNAYPLTQWATRCGGICAYQCERDRHR
jgi:molybdopterin-containing oxidoreductase family iron-sulfur binding subunit